MKHFGKIESPSSISSALKFYHRQEERIIIHKISIFKRFSIPLVILSRTDFSVDELNIGSRIGALKTK